MDDPATLRMLIAIVVIPLAIALAFFLVLARPWLRALMSGAQVPAATIVGMWLRGNPARLMIDAYIILRQSGHPATIADVERAYIINKSRILTTDDLVRLVNRTHPPDASS